ncbi:XdhC family protein [Bacillus sp. cl95]|uniref:XdhC family protein n=2 Tax=unclassified Bacillus (in: firmicutes) TaxID=185979 RepID=UPI0008E3B999|nr:XdhC family protein [Bacillus sp. cl95]SFB02380.1 xanthine dehydrogenase accessory factor [Bacillus sp. UNCCL13]SFQ89103.1 xanthine dehydrogenase accessory factor [Bacillus sp. cl95]
MMSPNMQQIMKDALDAQRVTALVTITTHSEWAYMGKKYLVWEDGSFYYEPPEKEGFSISLIGMCQELIRKRKTRCIRFQSDGEEVECFVEVLIPRPRLIIAGAGHVCEPVVQMASLLGYHITVIDDRFEFATESRFPLANEVICDSYLNYFRTCQITGNTWILLLTRGHQFDVISLQELLKRNDTPAYIGMIGSRRRIAGVFESLKEEFGDASFDHIYTPVGLDIGAETPAEIAVSILAEMLKVKNTKSGHSLSQDIRQLAKLGFRGGKSG